MTVLCYILTLLPTVDVQCSLSLLVIAMHFFLFVGNSGNGETVLGVLSTIATVIFVFVCIPCCIYCACYEIRRSNANPGDYVRFT